MAYKMTVVNPKPKGGRKMAKKKKSGGRKKASKKKHAKKKSTKKGTKRKGAGKKKRAKKGAKKGTSKKKHAKKGTGKKKGTKRKGGKKKATKKVAKRKAAKPAKPKRARAKWPVGVPRPKYTMGEAEGRLGRAGAHLSKSRGVGARKRRQIRGLPGDARRMQLASQGYTQVNPVEGIPGHPGMFVVKPGKGDKVRSKAVVVKTGKRSKTKAGRGTVSKRPSKKREEELNRIRRAAGIPRR